jgi:hypothetical protein
VAGNAPEAGGSEVSSHNIVMAGLDPAIHDLLSVGSQDVDARDKPGHDGERNERPGVIPAFFVVVIASEAKQSILSCKKAWIASSLCSSQ